MIDAKKTLFIRKIFEKGIVRFGSFTLKDGMVSPFYIDLRSIVAYPELIKLLTEIINENTNLDKRSLVCGVPYGAIPVAVSYGLSTDRSIILLRKESKSYGTAKMMEGAWQEGQSVILIEDVVTSGASILESAETIKQHGLQVQDVIIFVDRSQGGVEIIRSKGLHVYVMVSIFDILEVLKDELGLEKVQVVKDFINNNPVKADDKEKPVKAHAQLRHCLEKSVAKKSNLVLSADVQSTSALWDLCQKCAPYICGLKIHADIIQDFSAAFGQKLSRWAKDEHIFLIEDRKFADIGNTQHLQFSKGQNSISSWADLVTCHLIGGENSLKAFEETQDVALLGVVEMSSKGTLAQGQYTEACLNIMKKKSELFVGAIAQESTLPKPFLKFTPGIHLAASGDDKDQTYNSPIHAIEQQHTDFIIVGRGIYADSNPATRAQVYQETAWKNGGGILTKKLQQV